MKLATFNVNGIRARLPRLLEWLAREQPDVACLQELKCADDALRALHPTEEKLYTFWDYTAGCWQRDMGFRLDHLLCSPEAADRLVGADVDRWARGEEKASDHAPTWVELS
jgi:exonuclease III